MTKARTLADFNASGVLTSTSTLDATKLSGNLPALDGSALTSLTSGNLSGALPNIDGSALTNLPAGGLSQMSQFRLDNDVNNDQDPFTNWEEADDATYTRIGTVPTIDTGVFTLPATGIYLILWDVAANSYGSGFGGAEPSVGWEIYATTNATAADGGTGSWDRIARNTENFSYGGYYANTNLQAHFNCTNTATHKLKFTVSGTNNLVRTNGGTDTSFGGLSIIKISD